MSFVAKGVLKNGAVVFLCAAAMYMAAYLPWSFNARFSLVIVLLLIAGLYFRWYLMFLRGGHAELDILLDVTRGQKSLAYKTRDEWCARG